MIDDEDLLERRMEKKGVPAWAEGIDGEEIATREVYPDGKRNDQMAFQAWADYQNHAIGWL